MFLLINVRTLLFIPYIRLRLNYTLAGSSFQMDLTQRVALIASGTTVRVDTLEVDKRYPILRAEIIITCNGSSVLLTLRESIDKFIQAFLPPKYNEAFTLNNVEDINNKIVMYNLIYRGLCSCSSSQSVILTIESYNRFIPSDGLSPNVCKWKCCGGGKLAGQKTLLHSPRRKTRA